MNNRIAGKNLLTIFKYSGLAPFEIDTEIKINKQFHLYSKILIAIFCSSQFVISEVLVSYFKPLPEKKLFNSLL